MQFKKEYIFPTIATIALVLALIATFVDHSDKPNIDRLVCNTRTKQTLVTEWKPMKCSVCGWTLDKTNGNFTRDDGSYHNTALGETCSIEARKDDYEAETLERHSP